MTNIKILFEGNHVEIFQLDECNEDIFEEMKDCFIQKNRFTHQGFAVDFSKVIFFMVWEY